MSFLNKHHLELMVIAFADEDLANKVWNAINDGQSPDTEQVQEIVDLAVAAIVDGAPATLDTLNEIAAALNDDNNIANTLLAAIALKTDTTTFNNHANATNNPHSTTKDQVGLGNADNTSDLNKPISTATQTALGLKENTGVAASLIATHSGSSDPHGDRAYTDTQIANLIGTAPALLNTLGEIADAINDDEEIANTLLAAIALKENIGVAATLDAAVLEDAQDYTDTAILLLEGVLQDYADTGDATTLQAAKDYADTVIGGVSFPLRGPNGSVSVPTYGYESDDGTDTGGYLISDGILGWATNGVEGMALSTAGLEVLGGLKLGSYEKGFSGFDADGNLIKIPGYDYKDAADFYGQNFNTNIVPAADNAGRNFHSHYTSMNPIVDGSKQYWNIFTHEVTVGNDDSSFQVGDNIDIKSTLILGDLTFTSRRRGLDGDVISFEFVDDGTAGSETVSKTGFDYTVHMEAGVSTADQLEEVISTFLESNGNDASVAVTGTGSNAQNSTVGPVFLTGGVYDEGGIYFHNLILNSDHQSNIGNVAMYSPYFTLGNNDGDPLKANQVSMFGGNITMRDNTEATRVSAMEMGLNMSTSSKVRDNLRGWNMYGNAGDVGAGVLAFHAGFNMRDADYMNIFQSTINARNVNHTINVFADFNNITGDIGDNYNALAIQPNINSVDGFYGIIVNPNVDLARNYSVGLDVNMNNVTVYAGEKAFLEEQDLTIEFIQTGEFGNTISIEYTAGATAGAEVVTFTGGNAIHVQIEDGVSTATQIKNAIDAHLTVGPNTTVTITGTGSNPQDIFGPTNFAGGVNAGSKKAANFEGDVNINGALSFSGSLSLGALQAFASKTLVDGGGSPASIHNLISSPTIGANETIANADTLGVNTAALISIGDNSTVTTAFLGISALGLPAVLTVGAGATVDRIAGATFALSLDAGAPSGGTVDYVRLCNALALPNGNTTVNNLRGYEFSLPFGDVGTNIHGIYMDVDCHNYIKGALKIGTGADVEDAGLTLHVVGESQFDGQVGFFGTTPAGQYTSAGAVAAGAVYTAAEQQMLNEVYTALRGYGLLT